MKFYSRKIYPELKRHLAKKQVTVITGLRRTGKTTLLKKLLEDFHSDNVLYLDFERIDRRELFAEKNYDNILIVLEDMGLNFKKKVCLALDEVQLVENLPSVVKYFYDNYNIKFILSGSSSYYLKNLFSESLAGRKKIFELYPLDFGEYLEFNNIDHTNKGFEQKFRQSEYERLIKHYEIFLEFGGFPEVVLAKGKNDKKDILLDIISSYINIDIRSLADFKDVDNLYSLIKLLCQRIGTRLDYKKLSSICGLSRQTVKNYIDFFEKSYLVYRLPVCGGNPDKEIVKQKKIYFIDNGLANVLADLDAGQKLENAVFNQLKFFGKLSYYAKKSGKEIDFILDNKWSFEAKQTPAKDDPLNSKSILPDRFDQKYFNLIGLHPSANFKDFIWAGDIK